MLTFSALFAPFILQAHQVFGEGAVAHGAMDDLLAKSFEKVFEHIQHEGIKKGVDEKGIDRFIEECARLAGMTGAIAGVGGVLTAVVGIPASLLNNVVQQFRVTLAVMYHQKGRYEIPSFPQFMAIVGTSLGVEVGANVTRNVLIAIANSILARLGAAAGGALFPIIGAFIGGGLSYLFIKGIGKSLKALDLR